MKARPAPRLRSSILVEILAALGVVLVVSIGLRSVLEARLVGGALTRQSRELAAGRLAILTAGYSERERLLDVYLRAIAESLDADGLTAPARRHELIAQLGRTGRSFEMGLLEMIGPDGTPIAATERALDSEHIEQVREIEAAGRSALVETTGGPSVQAMAVPVGVGGNVLIGGYDFSDAFAYQMRSQIGDDGQTILVAGGRVVGSTLSDPPKDIPGKLEGSDRLPSAPTRVDGNDLVAYVAIGGGSEPTTSGALGVLMEDPVASLNQSLSDVRLFSSVFSVVVAFLLGWVLFRRLIHPLVALAQTAGRIAEGELDANFTSPRKDEIGRLAQSLQRMTRELQAKTTRLQEATRRLVSVQEQERRRLARDLHDGMQQQLVALAIKLRHASNQPQVSRELVGSLADDAEEASFALQELGRGISSTVLADQGLYAALRAAAGRSPLHVVMGVDPALQDERFAPDIESTLYYVVLEAMANAQKHAPGSVLTIRLSQSIDDLILRVADNGPGFQRVDGEGVGLQNMHDRVHAQGGSIVMISRVGEGTKIMCRVPIPSRESGGGSALPEVDEDRSDTPVEVGLL